MSFWISQSGRWGEAVSRILPRPSFARRFRPQLTLCDHAQSAASTAASPNGEDEELLGHFGFVLLEGLREKSSLLQRESNWTCQREPLWTIDRTHIDNISLIDVSYRKHIRKTGTLPYKLDGSWYFCVSICRLSWRQIGRSCYWPWSSSSPFW